MIVCLVTYLQAIMRMIPTMVSTRASGDPAQIFHSLFSPALIISAIILSVASLLFRILGIVFVAQKKNMPGGEQALWIIGFAILSFITGIVFMALAKSKGLIPGQRQEPEQAYKS
jgi:hypothetical protein